MAAGSDRLPFDLLAPEKKFKIQMANVQAVATCHLPFALAIARKKVKFQLAKGRWQLFG